MTCATCHRRAVKWGLCVGCAYLYALGEWKTTAEFIRAHRPPDTRLACTKCESPAVDSGLCAGHFAEVVLG